MNCLLLDDTIKMVTAIHAGSENEIQTKNVKWYKARNNSSKQA